MMCFFNDTATTEIYTLSLHDALPICSARVAGSRVTLSFWRPSRGPTSQTLTLTCGLFRTRCDFRRADPRASLNALIDRKSTRLNSSHANISYAVFCLKKKNYYFFLAH